MDLNESVFRVPTLTLIFSVQLKDRDLVLCIALPMSLYSQA